MFYTMPIFGTVWACDGISDFFWDSLALPSDGDSDYFYDSVFIISDGYFDSFRDSVDLASDGDPNYF